MSTVWSVPPGVLPTCTRYPVTVDSALRSQDSEIAAAFAVAADSRTVKSTATPRRGFSIRLLDESSSPKATDMPVLKAGELSRNRPEIGDRWERGGAHACAFL